jgi:hypothetical protein
MKKDQHAGTKCDLVLSSTEELTRLYIKDNVEKCTDVVFNQELAQCVIAVKDFADLLKPQEGRLALEYTARNHVRSVVRLYLSEVNKAHPSETTKAQFGPLAETMGLRSQESGSRSLVPDGNVLVMAGLTLLLAWLLTRR